MNKDKLILEVEGSSVEWQPYSNSVDPETVKYINSIIEKGSFKQAIPVEDLLRTINDTMNEDL